MTQAAKKLTASHQPDLVVVGSADYNSPAVSPSGRPILLVEDNPMDVDLTVHAFLDHQIVNPLRVCRDGEEALGYVDRHHGVDDPNVPVIVLLDLHLPKISGIEVLQAIKSHRVWRRIPVIILTTSRENIDIASAYEYGVNSYLVKPVDSESFTEMIKSIKLYWLITNEPPLPPASMEDGHDPSQHSLR